MRAKAGADMLIEVAVPGGVLGMVVPRSTPAHRTTPDALGAPGARAGDENDLFGVLAPEERDAVDQEAFEAAGPRKAKR